MMIIEEEGVVLLVNAIHISINIACLLPRHTENEFLLLILIIILLHSYFSVSFSAEVLSRYFNICYFGCC